MTMTTNEPVVEVEELVELPKPIKPDTATPSTERNNVTNPSLWNTPPTFAARLEGMPVQVRITYGNALCIMLDYKVAYGLGVYPALTVADTPKQAIAWIRTHVANPERERLIEYFTRLDSEAYWAYCKALDDERYAKWEAHDKECLEWMRSPEFRRLQAQQILLDASKPDMA